MPAAWCKINADRKTNKLLVFRALCLSRAGFVALLVVTQISKVFGVAPVDYTKTKEHAPFSRIITTFLPQLAQNSTFVQTSPYQRHRTVAGGLKLLYLPPTIQNRPTKIWIFGRRYGRTQEREREGLGEGAKCSPAPNGRMSPASWVSRRGWAKG